MTLIENLDEDGYYLPHHAAIKETSDTTKVRIVFDAKTNNGTSLNNLLMTSPIIPGLIAHLIRFRMYVLMSRQISERCIK